MGSGWFTIVAREASLQTSFATKVTCERVEAPDVTLQVFVL